MKETYPDNASSGDRNTAVILGGVQDSLAGRWAEIMATPFIRFLKSSYAQAFVSRKIIYGWLFLQFVLLSLGIIQRSGFLRPQGFELLPPSTLLLWGSCIVGVALFATLSPAAMVIRKSESSPSFDLSTDPIQEVSKIRYSFEQLDNGVVSALSHENLEPNTTSDHNNLRNKISRQIQQIDEYDAMLATAQNSIVDAAIGKLFRYDKLLGECFL